MIRREAVGITPGEESVVGKQPDIPAWEDEKTQLLELVSKIRLAVESGDKTALAGWVKLHSALSGKLNSTEHIGSFNEFVRNSCKVFSKSAAYHAALPERPAHKRHYNGHEILSYKDPSGQGMVSPRDIRLLAAGYALDAKPGVRQKNITEPGLRVVFNAIMNAKMNLSIAIRNMPFVIPR